MYDASSDPREMIEVPAVSSAGEQAILRTPESFEYIGGLSSNLAREEARTHLVSLAILILMP